MEQKVTTAVIIRPVYVGLEESRVDLWPRTLRLSVTNSLYYQCAVWNMCGGWDFGINEIVHTRDREERNFFEEQTKFSVKDPLTAGTTIRTWTIMPTGISAERTWAWIMRPHDPCHPGPDLWHLALLLLLRRRRRWPFALFAHTQIWCFWT